MAVEWPKELAEHPRTSTVCVGDVTSNPDAAGKGPPLIAGLRVRMGVNTGAQRNGRDPGRRHMPRADARASHAT